MAINKGSVEWFDYERREIVELTKAADSFALSLRSFSKLYRFFDFLDDDMKASIFSSAVISYARPFSPNKTSVGSKFILPKKLVSNGKNFSDAYHEHLMDLRNKFIAHHDSDYVDAIIVYHYLKFKFDAVESQVVRGGSAITQSINFPASAGICSDYYWHIHSALGSAGDLLQTKLAEYLAATNDYKEEFYLSRDKYSKGDIKWGGSHFPDITKPVELLPIGPIDVDEWLKRPNLTVNSDGYAYRDFKLSIEVDFDTIVMAPGGVPHRITNKQLKS